MPMDEKHASAHEHKHEHGHQHGPAWKHLHRDWRLWVAIALMLAAMFMYVLSNDESLQPGGGPPQTPMPAAGI